jgi:hypothetical protein
MQVTIWNFLKQEVISPLIGLRGKFIEKTCATIFYAFLTALFVFIVGLIVFLITQIPFYKEILPYVLIYIISVYFAYKTLIFDPPSLPIVSVGAIVGGIVFWVILLLTTIVFQLTGLSLSSLWAYFIDIVAMTFVFTLIYGILPDFLYSETRFNY